MSFMSEPVTSYNAKKRSALNRPMKEFNPRFDTPVGNIPFPSHILFCSSDGLRRSVFLTLYDVTGSDMEFMKIYTNLVHLTWTNFNKIHNGTDSDHGASNGVSFIEINSVVSEHGLCCIDFWWFWTNLVHLM